MNFLTLLIAFIIIPCIVFSQTAYKKTLPEHKMNARKAAIYYLKKKIDPSPNFSIQYSSLFSGLQRYTKYDTLRANKIINRLYEFNDILFYRLMRIRLQWEFKQRIVKAPLDSVRPLLKNNIDSAKYYYMVALYFQDSMSERLARTYGYVKSTSRGDEVVDWVKMRNLNWGDPKVIENIAIQYLILTPKDHEILKDHRTRDSSIFYYKLTVFNDPTEFHYLKELIQFMAGSPGIKDEEIKQVINAKLPNYTYKEKKLLKKYLAHLNTFKK